MAHTISSPSNPEALDLAVAFLSRQMEPRTSYCGSTLSCLRFQHGLLS